MNRLLRRNTPLMAWMTANAQNPPLIDKNTNKAAKDLLYGEMADHIVFVKNPGKWKKRDRETKGQISRLYQVSTLDVKENVAKEESGPVLAADLVEA